MSGNRMAIARKQYKSESYHICLHVLCRMTVILLPYVVPVYECARIHGVANASVLHGVNTMYGRLVSCTSLSKSCQMGGATTL